MLNGMNIITQNDIKYPKMIPYIVLYWFPPGAIELNIPINKFSKYDSKNIIRASLKKSYSFKFLYLFALDYEEFLVGLIMIQ